MGLAGATFAALGIRQARRNERAFFSMDWSTDAAEDLAEGACVMIGEETFPKGKQWYVCNDDKSDDMECELVSGYGAEDGADQWLCKRPKVGA